MAKRLIELKRECLERNLDLQRLGLVFFTFGNVSVFEPDKAMFAIKPSGVPYKEMKPSDIVIVDLDCKVISGKLRPSSDTPTHAVLYKNFKGITSIVHTHSTYATAWAQSIKDVPVLGTTHADHLAFPIPCTEIMPDTMIQQNYELSTGLHIVETFKNRGLNPEEIEMVLVASHGPFTWGKTSEKAVYNSKVLEEICKMAFLTLSINPEILPLKDTLIKKHYERKHGKNSYYGQKKD